MLASKHLKESIGILQTSGVFFEALKLGKKGETLPGIMEDCKTVEDGKIWCGEKCTNKGTNSPTDL